MLSSYIYDFARKTDKQPENKPKSSDEKPEGTFEIDEFNGYWSRF